MGRFWILHRQWRVKVCLLATSISLSYFVDVNVTVLVPFKYRSSKVRYCTNDRYRTCVYFPVIIYTVSLTFCCSVPYFTRTSMFPVSGALQLNTCTYIVDKGISKKEGERDVRGIGERKWWHGPPLRRRDSGPSSRRGGHTPDWKVRHRTGSQGLIPVAGTGSTVPKNGPQTTHTHTRE